LSISAIGHLLRSRAMPTTTFAIALPFPCAISCRSSAPLQMGSGWQLSNILNLQSGEPMSFYDSSDDISFSGEFLDRWDFSGNPSDVHWTTDPAKPMTYLFDSDNHPAQASGNPQCQAAARPGADLGFYGCFISGSAVITPPPYRTFGNMARNLFRGPAMQTWISRLPSAGSLVKESAFSFVASSSTS